MPFAGNGSVAAVSSGGRWLIRLAGGDIIRRDLLTGAETTLPGGPYDDVFVGGFLGTGPSVVIRVGLHTSPTLVIVWSAGTVEAFEPDLGKCEGDPTSPLGVGFVLPSPLGRYVLLEVQPRSQSCTPVGGLAQIWLLDTQLGLTTKVSDYTLFGALAFDGRTIVYSGHQFDLATGTTTLRRTDPADPTHQAIYLWDHPLVSGRTMVREWFDPQRAVSGVSIWDPITDVVWDTPARFTNVTFDDAVLGVGVAWANENNSGGRLLIDLRTGASTPLPDPASISGVRLSPDGRFVLVNRYGDRFDVMRVPFPLTDGSVLTIASPTIPAGATAALTNLTMTGGLSPGYITADQCSMLAAGPQTKSNGNHLVADAIANLSVVPLDGDGSFCVYNSAPVHVLADVQGYFAAAGVGGQEFTPLAPSRKLDTRQPGLVRPAAGSITRVETGVGAGTTAVLVNLTMAGGTSPGYITADKCSALTPGQQTKSTGNFSIDTAIANLSVVAVDPDGSFCIYNHQPVHLIVDLQGLFAPPTPSGLGFTPTSPTRVLDTRQPPRSRPAAGTITRVSTGTPAGTSAVLVNLTMAGGATSGYITADKCSTLAAGAQTKSNGNHGADAAIANLSVVALDPDGSFCIYNERAVDLIVDIQGSFSTTGTQAFYPTIIDRALDTRVQ